MYLKYQPTFAKKKKPIKPTTRAKLDQDIPRKAPNPIWFPSQLLPLKGSPFQSLKIVQETHKLNHGWSERTQADC